MGNKKGMTGLGLTTMAPGVQGSMARDDWRAELAGLIRDRRDVMLAKEIGVFGPADNARQAEQPAASTLTEATKAVVDTAKTATDLYRDVANTNRDERKAAEDRARQAEEKAEKRSANAAESARAEGATMLEIFKDFFNETRERDRRLTEIRLSTEKQIGEIKTQLVETKLGALESKFDARFQAIEEKYQLELRQKEEKIAELAAKNQALSQRETLEDAAFDLVMTGKKHPIFEGALRLMGGGANGDPNSIYQSIVAEGMAKADVAKAQAEVTKKENEVEHAKELHGVIKKGADAVVDLVNTARVHLPLLFGQPPIVYEPEDEGPIIDINAEQAAEG